MGAENIVKSMQHMIIASICQAQNTMPQWSSMFSGPSTIVIENIFFWRMLIFDLITVYVCVCVCVCVCKG